jgi:hypothetical protein
MTARLATTGIEAIAYTPTEFGDFLKRDFEQWVRVARDARIELE